MIEKLKINYSKEKLEQMLLIRQALLPDVAILADQCLALMIQLQDAEKELRHYEDKSPAEGCYDGGEGATMYFVKYYADGDLEKYLKGKDNESP